MPERLDSSRAGKAGCCDRDEHVSSNALLLGDQLFDSFNALLSPPISAFDGDEGLSVCGWNVNADVYFSSLTRVDVSDEVRRAHRGIGRLVLLDAHQQ